MASEAYANDFETTLNGAIASASRPVNVVLTDAPPATLSGGNWRFRVGDEYLLVPAGGVSGSTLTGCTTVESSVAAIHADLSKVDQVLTRQGLLNSPGPMTTQGDITYLDSTLNPVRLALGAAGTALVSDAGATGIPKWAVPTGSTNAQSSRAYRNAALSLTGGSVWTKFPLDTNDFDPSSLQVLASNRFVVGVAGRYFFNGGFQKGDTTTRVQLAVYVNGSQRDLLDDNVQGFEGGTAFIDLAVNDQVELWYNSNATPAVTVGKYTAFAEIALLVGAAPAPSTTGLLAHLRYDPGTRTQYTTSSTTYAAVDGTNLSLGFVAPASGAVIIVLSALAYGVGNEVWNQWGVGPHGGSVDANTKTGITSLGSSTSKGRHEARCYVSGLTPGASYTYDWFHASGFGGSTVGMDAGIFAGGDGPAIMEVWSA